MVGVVQSRPTQWLRPRDIRDTVTFQVTADPIRARAACAADALRALMVGVMRAGRASAMSSCPFGGDVIVPVHSMHSRTHRRFGIGADGPVWHQRHPDVVRRLAHPARFCRRRRPRRPSLQIGGTPWTVIRGVAEPDDVCQVALTCRAQPLALAWRHRITRAALGHRGRRWAAVALGRRRLVGAA